MPEPLGTCPKHIVNENYTYILGIGLGDFFLFIVCFNF